MRSLVTYLLVLCAAAMVGCIRTTPEATIRRICAEEMKNTITHFGEPFSVTYERKNLIQFRYFNDGGWGQFRYIVFLVTSDSTCEVE